MKRYYYFKKANKFLMRFSLALFISIAIYLLYVVVIVDMKSKLGLTSSTLSTDYKAKSRPSDGRSADVMGIFAPVNERPAVVSEQVSIDFGSYDYRAFVFDQYFKKNGSPLYGFGASFSHACDKYNAPHDCTLLPAIARVETNLCKTGGSFSQKNCWGYGGSGSNRIIYKNFDQAIDDITKRLVSGYGVAFFKDPEIGELYYCGAHCTRWGDHVKAEQTRIRQFAKGMGYEL